MPNIHLASRSLAAATPSTSVEILPGASALSSAPSTDDSFSRGSGSTHSRGGASASPLVRPHAGVSPRAILNSGRIPSLPASTLRALTNLSNPDTVTSPEDFASRIEQIDDIFVANQDPRGAFSSLYRVITNQAVASVREGRYEDNVWAAKLVTDFGDLYLKNLHAHLRGKRVSAGWTRYYQLADNPNVTLERLASVGATVHLVVDMPDSLARIGTSAARKEDFTKFGDILLEAYPQMLASARDGYNSDMSNIFGLFFFGNIADAIAGEGTATRFGFQTIRTKAWIFGQRLQTLRCLEAKAEITISWRTIDGILANLDAAKVL